ncbi:MAG: hypothetical protein QMC67_00010 [Candidatus Wallbacteria bacterium]
MKNLEKKHDGLLTANERYDFTNSIIHCGAITEINNTSHNNKNLEEALTEKQAATHFNDEEINCHIHKITPQYLQKELEAKIISAGSPQARTIKNIKKGDLILFLTALPSYEKTSGPSKKLMFVASAEVDNIFDSQQHYIGYDLSPIKINIKNIKYFNCPINGDEYVKIYSFKNKNIISQNAFLPDLKNIEPSAIIETEPVLFNHYASEDSTVPNTENITISDLIKTEYKKIARYDFLLLTSNYQEQSTIMPEYLTKVIETSAFEPKISEPTQKYSKNEMIDIFKISLNMYKAVRIKETQILINDFLIFVKNVFDSAGIYKTIEQIKDSYSKLAINLKFDHIHTRETSKSFPVVDKFGKEVRFGYIRLKSDNK